MWKIFLFVLVVLTSLSAFAQEKQEEKNTTTVDGINKAIKEVPRLAEPIPFTVWRECDSDGKKCQIIKIIVHFSKLSLLFGPENWSKKSFGDTKGWHTIYSEESEAKFKLVDAACDIVVQEKPRACKKEKDDDWSFTVWISNLPE